MIHFTIDSVNISALFLRTAEHTFGIRCLTSLIRILMRYFRGIPFNLVNSVNLPSVLLSCAFPALLVSKGAGNHLGRFVSRDQFSPMRARTNQNIYKHDMSGYKCVPIHRVLKTLIQRFVREVNCRRQFLGWTLVLSILKHLWFRCIAELVAVPSS